MSHITYAIMSEMSESDYRTNQSILYTTTSTKQFVRALVNKYCFGQDDLVNYPVMRHRIRSIMRSIDTTMHRDNVVRVVTADVLAVLMVLKGELVVDQLFEEHHWIERDIEKEIDWFLVRKGIIEPISDDDEVVTQQVEHLAIDEKEDEVIEPKQIENLSIEDREMAATTFDNQDSRICGKKSAYICLRD